MRSIILVPLILFVITVYWLAIEHVVSAPHKNTCKATTCSSDVPVSGQTPQAVISVIAFVPTTGIDSADFDKTIEQWRR